MKTKKGNVTAIALIVVIVAITAGTIGWMFAKKTNNPQLTTDNEKEKTYAGGEPRSLLYTQPKDETADWQTYTNSQYGYSIKYPKDYEAKIIKGDVAAFGPKGFSTPAPISINIFRPTPPASLESFVNAGKNNLELKDCNKINIASKAAYECLSLGAVTSYMIISEHNGFIYKFYLNTGNKDSLAENKAALDTNQKLILSTFKFTNATDETADWQTFKSGRFGVELRYPKINWKIYDNENSIIIEKENVSKKDEKGSNGAIINASKHDLNYEQVINGPRSPLKEMLLDARKISINGIAAYETEHDKQWFDIWILSDKYDFEIMLDETTYGNPEFSKILSSFKLTD